SSIRCASHLPATSWDGVWMDARSACDRRGAPVNSVIILSTAPRESRWHRSSGRSRTMEQPNSEYTGGAGPRPRLGRTGGHGASPASYNLAARRCGVRTLRAKPIGHDEPTRVTDPTARGPVNVL